MWNWERVDTGRAPVSGDLAKFFKNEAVKQPGLLAANAPSTDATVLAREAIQNSWDAARALRERQPADVVVPDFVMRFRFSSVTGSAKESLIESLGLRSLRDRSDAGDRRKLGLAEEDALTHLDDLDVPLRMLYVEESATTGMDGPWDADRSKLYLALVAVGFTMKADGSGGSFGFGKAGLIRGSRLRTVLAYTCFEERFDDLEVTRRFLGMTYWGQHHHNGGSWTGFARYGLDEGTATVPLENEDADAAASSLGIAVRSSDEVSQLGSTFLLLDPTVGAEDLVAAIERNWWPALHSKEFRVEVIDYDGTKLHARPKRNKDLKAFIRGYELANASQDNQPLDEYRKSLRSYQPQGQERFELGMLGLKADLAGWSYATNAGTDDDGAVLRHESLVALVRGPKMVVEYLQTGSAEPYVRGTFVASPDVDELLRQTEPKAHDAWQTRVEEEGLDSHAPKIAGEILKRIRTEVREFRKLIKPPPPRQQDLRLPFFDELVRNLFDHKGSKQEAPPRADPRKVSIRVEQRVDAVDADTIRMSAVARMSLVESVPDSSLPIRIRFRYAFDEDGHLGEECEISVDLAAGFEVDADDDAKGFAALGDLGHEEIVFRVESAPYASEWSGQLIVSADPIVESTESEEVMEGAQ